MNQPPQEPAPASWARSATCTRLFELQLGQQPRHVRLDRGHAHEQLGRDLGVRLALADRDRHLALPLGQPAEQLARVRAAGRAGAVVGDVLDQPPGHRRRQHRLARRDQPDRPQDLRRRGVLEQEPAAPARSARSTYSSASNVVSTITCGASVAARAAPRWRPARRPAASGCPSAPRRAVGVRPPRPHLGAVGRLADHLDVVGAARIIDSPARTSASSSTISTRIGRSRRPRARPRPRQPEVAASGGAPVLEPPAGQAGPLGEPDQAGAGARDPAPGRARRPATGCGPRPSGRRRAAPSTAHVDRRPAARACARWSAPPARSGRRCGPSASGTATSASTAPVAG